MKRIMLAVFLCVTMVLCIMPMSAAAAESYAVTYNLTNMTASGSTETTAGEDLHIVFSADEGYMMPDAVTVTVNGVLLDSALYSVGVTKLTGELRLLADDITGDIVVTAEAVKKYEVYFVGESWAGGAPVPAGQSLNSYYGSPDLALEKEGYVFEGWFESVDGGETLSDTPFDFDTVLQSDVTVYPKWTAQTTDSGSTTTTTTATTTTTVTATTAATSPTVSPQTGHSGMYVLCGGLAVLALGGVVLALRRLMDKASR